MPGEQQIGSLALMYIMLISKGVQIYEIKAMMFNTK